MIDEKAVEINGDSVINEEENQDQATKFRNEKQMILDWLADFEQRKNSLITARERLSFINGWLASNDGIEVI